MKKTTRFLSMIILLISVFALNACLKPSTVKEVKIYLPDGAPSLAMASIMEQPEMFSGYKLSFSIVSGDNIVAKVSSKEADLAILPTNAASIIHNKGTSLKLLSANVFGLLYMVGKTEFENLNDLIGKVVLSIGQGSTAEYVFKHILTEKGIPFVDSDVAVNDKLAIHFVADASSAIPLLLQNKFEYAILGEPAVTQAESKGLKNLLDLQKEWSNITEIEGGYPQAGLVGQKAFVESNGDFINQLMSKLSDNKKYITDNAAKIGKILRDNGSFLTGEYTAEIINRCNMDFVDAKSVRNSLETYYNVLLSFKPQSIGNKLPSNEFYYGI